MSKGQAALALIVVLCCASSSVVAVGLYGSSQAETVGPSVGPSSLGPSESLTRT